MTSNPDAASDESVSASSVSLAEVVSTILLSDQADSIVVVRVLVVATVAQVPHEGHSSPEGVANTQLRGDDAFGALECLASIIWCSQKLFDYWVNGDGFYLSVSWS